MGRSGRLRPRLGRACDKTRLNLTISSPRRGRGGGVEATMNAGEFKREHTTVSEVWKVMETHDTIDTLLHQWQSALGKDYLPYRNHVYRIFHFASRLAD